MEDLISIDNFKEVVKSVAQSYVPESLPLRFPCDNCDRGFTRKDGLMRHIKSCYRKNKYSTRLFICELCETQFSNRNSASRHIKTIHGDKCLNRKGNCNANNSFQCDNCQKEFARKDSLVRHLKTCYTMDKCSIQLLKCELCDFGFTNRSSLVRHKRTIHGNEMFRVNGNCDINLTFCDACQREFKRKDGLIRHIKTCSQSKAARYSVEKFECDVCGKQLKSLYGMARHKYCIHEKGRLNSKKSYHTRTKLQCDTCKRLFVRKDNLKRHLHSDKCPAREKPVHHMLQCDTCKREFNRKFHLRRHCSRHIRDGGSKCVECNAYFLNAQVIFKRVMAQANIKVDHEHLDFATKDDFFKWKDNLEKSTVTCYRVKNVRNSKQYTTYKFICHRSGTYKIKDHDRKREKKLYGSKKVGGYCPAQIQVRMKDETGSCKVLHIKTHLRHNVSNKKEELRHIYLQKRERALNGSLVIRTSVTTPRSSVPINVDNFVWQHPSLIIYYKKQHELDDRYPSLSTDDIIVVAMNDLQEQLLQKYGENIVMVDGTRKLHKYHFLMLTLLVVDDDNEWIEVAFAFSNRNDEQLASVFFDCIKETVGCIKPKILMTDTEDSYSRNWREVMGEPHQRLFCPWLVKDDWRRNFKKIRKPEKRNRMRNLLYEISSKRNEDVFLTELLKLLDDDDPEVSDFLMYFSTHYVQNVEAWAYCYRKGARVNTGMYNKTFQSILKSAARKQNIRGKVPLDFCLEELSVYLEPKNGPVVQKKIKGKITSNLRFLRRNHKLIEKENRLSIRGSDSEGWYVSFPASGADEADVYFICLTRQNCQECKLYCTKCEACVHKFECSCMEGLVRYGMCIHIHALCLFLRHNNLNYETQSDDSDAVTHEDFIIESEEEIPVELIEEKYVDSLEGMPIEIIEEEYLDSFEKVPAEIVGKNPLETVEEIFVDPMKEESMIEVEYATSDDTMQKLKMNILTKLKNISSTLNSEKDLSQLLSTINSVEHERGVTKES